MIEILEGFIFRDGQNIGIIQGDVAKLTTDQSGVIKGQIRKAAGKPELTFSLQESPVDPTSAALDVVVGVQAEPRAEGVVPDTPPPVLDPEPPRGPGGDKTPALVEWRRKHWTAERFNATYAHRGIPPQPTDK